MFKVTNRFPKKFYEKILFFQNERKVKTVEEPLYEEIIVAIGLYR